MMSAQDLVPQAFWNALANQNLTAFGPPQWSIVVNDSGVQCSLFFENGEGVASSTKSSETSAAVSSVSPQLMKNGVFEGEKTKSSDESFDKMDEEEIENIVVQRATPPKPDDEQNRITPPAMIPSAPVVSSASTHLPGIPNIPLLQQFLGQQIAAAVANGGSGGGGTTLGGSPADKIEKATPGDLMLISQENRRRLLNLREEATANRLSVTAFIRRGALLYFDSDELALNRLHTLDQKRLSALELETKYFFGDIPQQLFRRTIAIQQSQIRSKKSNSREERVRFRPNNSFNFNFNPNNLVSNLSAATVQQRDVAMPQMALPTSLTNQMPNPHSMQMTQSQPTALKLEP